MAGILATKVEMTRIVKGNDFVPVTLLRVPTLKVVGIKTEATDGYNALIVGILKEKSEGILKEWKKTLSVNEFSEIREFPLENADLEKFHAGDDITLDILEGVTLVKLSGISKGKWFAGAMKRHNFGWGRKTHGSKFHRALGSIGTRKPRRTQKGKKMHGHMGDEKITLRDVPVELVNKELSIIGVRWPVPGARNSLVTLVF